MAAKQQSIRKTRLVEVGPLPAVVSKPRLAGSNFRRTKAFKFLDPETLQNPSFGYSEAKTPWIISNDDALAGVKRLPDNFVNCTVTSPP
jgi:hypothetical protein